jgi:hypothetical protein
MKKLAVLLLLHIAAVPVLAEDATVIAGKPVGFGDLTAKLTRINDSFGVFVGVETGWIIDNRFAIGTGGHILAKNIRLRHGVTWDLGYGGLVIEYILVPLEPVRFSVQSLIGAGALTYSGDYDANEGGWHGHVLFVAEPAVSVTANVLQTTRIALEVSYRSVDGVDRKGISWTSDSGLSGVTVGLTCRFGTSGI